MGTTVRVGTTIAYAEADVTDERGRLLARADGDGGGDDGPRLRTAR